MSKEEFEENIKKTENISKRVRNIGWIFVGLGFVALVIGFFYWLSFGGKLNEVGDFVGGVSGSLWALAGLFFIYVAFLGQKIEIKYQQEELKLNREELRESKEVFKAQADIMLDQKLDTTFFNLLDNHRKVVQSFKDKEGIKQNIIGYEALENQYQRLKWYFKEYSNFLKTRNLFSDTITRSNPISRIKHYRDVEILYNEVSGIVDFTISKVRKENQDFYLKTLFNNLSNQEKFLLTAYNINCSKKYIKELDFENYLKYELRDFSKEDFFISNVNAFFNSYDSSKGNGCVKIKIFDKNLKNYKEIDIYVVQKDKKVITQVLKINRISNELEITDKLIKITKEHFIDKLDTNEQEKYNEFEYPLILQMKNLKYNFIFYHISIIEVRTDFRMFEFKIDGNYSNFSDWSWIRDHFNNPENQNS